MNQLHHRCFSPYPNHLKIASEAQRLCCSGNRGDRVWNRGDRAWTRGSTWSLQSRTFSTAGALRFKALKWDGANRKLTGGTKGPSGLCQTCQITQLAREALTLTLSSMGDFWPLSTQACSPETLQPKWAERRVKRGSKINTQPMWVKVGLG